MEKKPSAQICRIYSTNISIAEILAPCDIPKDFYEPLMW